MMSEKFTFNTYCRKLREVKAVQVQRSNAEQLQSFVLGGEMLIPKRPNAKAVFTFKVPHRAYKQDAYEGDWILTANGLDFEVMTDAMFRDQYEPK